MGLRFRLIPVKKKERDKSEEDKEKAKLIRGSELLKHKIRTVDITKPDNSWLVSYSPSQLRYQRALELKEKLLKKYQGAVLEDILEGKTIKNGFGECFKITSHYTIQLDNLEKDRCIGNILSNLQLVYGIGPYYEAQLKTEGYRNIEDLRKHPQWNSPARRFLDIFHGDDVATLHEWMWRFVPKSHPNVYHSSALINPEEFLLFDIETMGLFEAVIILLGLAKQRGNKIYVTQYLLKDVSNEPCALIETYKEFQGHPALITYNGKTFDLPYFRNRLAFYGLDPIKEMTHFDLLHYTRRIWSNRLPDCTLDTLESHLGIDRAMDLPSAMVPHFYEAYLDTNNPGPLIPIIEHNKQDLLTLATLFSKIHEEWS